MVSKQDIKNEMLNEGYLVTQAEGLVFEFNKLKNESLADDNYIIEKIGNIIKFIGDIGINTESLKDDIKQAVEGYKHHIDREKYLKLNS